MFKSEARLFLSANNNVNSAKTLINECKRLIVDFDLAGDSNNSDLKNNISSCNIDFLVNKIEETKESLMKLDQTFASEYMTLLQEYLQSQTIDTSNMTEEEQMQYNIQMNAYARDYNRNLLYMLEKYEESDMLTDEMKQQLKYQRELVAQYDIQDKMAVLDSTSKEYIDLFKKNAESDRKLINLNPSLTNEQKASYLEAYETTYNKNLKSLQEARDYKIKNQKLEQELQDLYKTKEDNNGFWHPFVEGEIDEAILDKKIEIGKFNPKSPYAATKDDIDYKNMNGWDRFWTDTGTFLTSTFTGLYNISEGIEDGFVTLGSAVGIVDKDWATEFTSKDLSGELYQGIVLSTGMNTYSAYGTWHEAGEAFGEFAGHVAMSFSAPWANAVMSGLESMGHQAETSFNNGDDYWIAVGKSFISGVGGAAEGYAHSKMNMGFQEMLGKGTIKKLKNQVLTNAKSILSKEGLKQTGKTFGHSLVSAAIDPYSLIVSGCLVADDFMNFLATGEFDLEETLKKAGQAYLFNFGMEFASNLAFGYKPFGKNSSQIEELFDPDATVELVDPDATVELVDGDLNNNPYSFNESDLTYERSNIIKQTSYRLESNINRYRYTDTNLVEGLNDSIKENGLYHFSEKVDEILDSGYVRSSGYFSSYGERKSFFFNGVPEVGAYVSNLDDIPLKTKAIRISPSDELLNSSKLKVRNYDDFAITYSGDLKFNPQDASKQYFVLRKVDDKLVYANVNKAFYDNYQNTAEGLAVAEFISKKKNKNLIKQDYYYNLAMKSTNAHVTYSKFKTGVDYTSNKNKNYFVDPNTPNKMFDNNNLRSKSNFVQTRAWETEIAKINRYTNDGYSQGIRINSIEELPDDFFERLTNLDNVYFIVNGKNMSWEQVYSIKNLNNRSLNNVFESTTKVHEVQIDNNNNNLRQKILSRLPGNANELEQTKYIYNKLNEELAYSSEFYFGDKAIKQNFVERMSKGFDINNVTDNKIVCTNWAESYAKLLKEVGINAKVMGTGHKWVAFELSDGTKWVADATQPYNGFTDLTNAKIGSESGGFFQVTNEMYNSHSLLQGTKENKNAYKIPYQQSNFMFSNNQILKNVDRNIGYDYISVDSLFSNVESKQNIIFNSNLNSTYGEIVSKKLEEVIFPTMEKLDTMEGLGYYVAMRKTFSGIELNSLPKAFPIIKSDGSYYLTFSIDLGNGKTAEYIYDGIGKITKGIVENLR